MNLLLAAALVLFTLPAAAEVPYASTDTAVNENFEYISRQFKKLSNKVQTREVCFSDGTCQTSATETVQSDFTTVTTYSSVTVHIGPIILGSTATGAGYNSAVEIIARSIDGASQSENCLVVVAMSNTAGNAYATFTSTDTSGINGKLGSLRETCAPGAYCRVAVLGITRIAANGAVASPFSIQSSATRCQSQNGTTGDGMNNCGIFLTSGGGAGTVHWAFLSK